MRSQGRTQGAKPHLHFERTKRYQKPFQVCNLSLLLTTETAGASVAGSVCRADYDPELTIGNRHAIPGRGE